MEGKAKAKGGGVKNPVWLTPILITAPKLFNDFFLFLRIWN